MGDEMDAMKYFNEAVKKYSMHEYLTDTDAWYLSNSNTMSSPGQTRIQPSPAPNPFVGIGMGPDEEDSPMSTPKTELDSVVDEILSEMKPTVVVGKPPSPKKIKKVRQIQVHQHHAKKPKGFVFPIKRPTISPAPPETQRIASMIVQPGETLNYKTHDGLETNHYNGHPNAIRIIIEEVL